MLDVSINGEVQKLRHVSWKLQIWGVWPEFSMLLVKFQLRTKFFMFWKAFNGSGLRSLIVLLGSQLDRSCTAELWIKNSFPWRTSSCCSWFTREKSHLSLSKLQLKLPRLVQCGVYISLLTWLTKSRNFSSLPFLPLRQTPLTLSRCQNYMFLFLNNRQENFCFPSSVDVFFSFPPQIPEWERKCSVFA